MDESRFDALSRFLVHTPSRRRLTRLLGGLVLSGSLPVFVLMPREAGAKKGKRHRKGKKRRGQVLPPSPPPPRLLNASCVDGANEDLSMSTTGRVGQTFTEPNGGQLTAAEILFNQAGTTGTYLLQVNTVNAATGVPTNNTIAATTLPAAAVRQGTVGAQFIFETPATLIAGRQYALVLSRPTGTGDHLLPFGNPGGCGGGEAFLSANATATFEPLVSTLPGADFVYATFVSP